MSECLEKSTTERRGTEVRRINPVEEFFVKSISESAPPTCMHHSSSLSPPESRASGYKECLFVSQIKVEEELNSKVDPGSQVAVKGQLLLVAWIRREEHTLVKGQRLQANER